MKLKFDKRSVIAGLIVFAAIAVFLLVKKKAYIGVEDLNRGPLLYFLSFLCALAVGAVVAFRIEYKDKNLAMLISVVFFFVSPVISITMVEIFQGQFSYDLAPKYFVANYICYMVIMLIVFAISGHIGRAIFWPNVVFYIFGMANNIAITLRGTPFVPTDFISVDTGLDVSGSYEAYIDWCMIMGSLFLAFMGVVCMKMRALKIESFKYNMIARIVSAGCVVAMATTLYSSDVVAQAGIKPDFWNQLRGYHNSGSFMNFVINTKYLIITEPDDYDADEVADIMSELSSLSDYEPSITATEDMPNIICVMNESYSELKVDGDFETNVGYMNFYNSLSENTIKGNLFVPVNGAGTSNSEFEFLTGMSLNFLPSGSNIYDLYIKEETPSLVSTMASLGYSRTAFHPYYEEGWNRNVVYPLLDFEDFISIEDIIDEDILQQYEDSDNNVYVFESLLEDEFPGEDILVRRYIGDSYDYKVIEDLYEEHEKTSDEQPFFMFNVTMQNHGGYATDYYNFDEDVEITSMSKIYTLANQYLSLIKVSDEALSELIEYYENCDEPTIVLMFGDHQPYVETAFFEELFGTSVDSLTTEQLQQRYITPFLIWANYDIDVEQTQYDYISSNYLSTLLLETAGLPMTEFNKYLSQLYEKLPVIDSVGYIDSEGNYYTYNEQTEYTQLLADYEKIQYNDLFDVENRQNQLFYLQDE